LLVVDVRRATLCAMRPEASPDSFDSWDTVQQAAEGEVVLVAYVSTWFKLAVYVYNELMKVKTRLPPGVRLCVLNADVALDQVYSFGVHTTPCLMVFSSGSPFWIRRPHFDDDTKVFGSLSGDQIIEFTQKCVYARENALSLIELSF